MPGLVPGIHVLAAERKKAKTWMAGTSPAMTSYETFGRGRVVRMRTQVGIVGAGPAGLLLAHLLDRAGVDCVVLESRSRGYCEERQRAGLLEQGTVDLLNDLGVGARLAREGLVHHGLALRFEGVSHRIPLSDLAGGKSVVIYGQTEVVKDLIAARLAGGRDIRFEAEAVALEGLDTPAPVIRFREHGREQTLTCDFVAGCDGFHGICR